MLRNRTLNKGNALKYSQYFGNYYGIIISENTSTISNECSKSNIEKLGTSGHICKTHRLHKYKQFRTHAFQCSTLMAFTQQEVFLSPFVNCMQQIAGVFLSLRLSDFHQCSTVFILTLHM